ncbi:MAG: TonB-dependent receptor, partial [Bacteroidales bacterium]|nr:TonB-dependent receptor [Bacteroidales bacterium]
VSGKVTDSSGQSLPGVTVVVKGTTQGTVTNANGNYSLTNIPEDAMLVFSFVGMKTQEVVVGNQTNINVNMEEETIGIEEVVAIGYGTQKKSDIVGSVTSISSQELERTGSINILDAMQGIAPGIRINRNNGEPGSTGSIMIRGQNSISASNSPLIILDGIPYDGDIAEINPNDIQSIEVLKDASASAIYGSKASNGVILITSKMGKKGKPVIEINASSAFQNLSFDPDLQTPDEFLAYRMEAYRAAGKPYAAEDVLYKNELDMYNAGESVDWMKLMMRKNAPLNELQMNVRGGTDHVIYYLSGSYTDQKTLEVNTDYKRTTLKPNFEIILTDWMKVGDNMLVSYTKSTPSASKGSWADGSYYEMSPFGKIFEDDGSFTIYPMSGDNFYPNFYADDLLKKREQKILRLFNNLFTEIELPLPGLKYRLNYGIEVRNSKSNSYWPRQTLQGELMQGQASISHGESTSWTIDNIVTYKKTISDHSIDITGLYSRQHYTSNDFSASATGFVSDDFGWNNLSAGAINGQSYSNAVQWDMVSYMLRMNYNYRSRYYLTATARKDGYSAFGPNNKYGLFPSVALAWRLSEEEFMKNANWLNELKLRGSYGKVGNQAISSYASLSRLNNYGVLFDKTSVNGLALASMQNQNLKWETTTSANIAMDFALLDHKINGTVEYYKSNTRDLLLQRNIPKMTGFPSVWDNIGKTMNRGFEMQLTFIPVRNKDWNWNINLNFSTNHNEIVELYGNKKDDLGNSWFIGKPIGVFYDTKFLGIWQTNEVDQIPSSAQPDAVPGDPKLEDFSGPGGVPDGKIDGNDRQILGYSQPKWTGGLTNTVSYKGVNLSVSLYTMQDFDKRVRFLYADGRFTQYRVNFWTPENPSNEFLRPNQGGVKGSGSMNLFDASFIRVKNISLSYTFPQELVKHIGINSLSTYINLRDYFLFTDFPFTDPEISSGNTFPLNKTMEFGVRLSL